MLSAIVIVTGFVVTGALVYGAVMLFVEADARELLSAPKRVEEAPEIEGTHTAGPMPVADAPQDERCANPTRLVPGAFS